MKPNHHRYHNCCRSGWGRSQTLVHSVWTQNRDWSLIKQYYQPWCCAWLASSNSVCESLGRAARGLQSWSWEGIQWKWQRISHICLYFLKKGIWGTDRSSSLDSNIIHTLVITSELWHPYISVSTPSPSFKHNPYSSRPSAFPRSADILK
jgi:hypothetical protein